MYKEIKKIGTIQSHHNLCIEKQKKLGQYKATIIYVQRNNKNLDKRDHSFSNR